MSLQLMYAGYMIAMAFMFRFFSKQSTYLPITKAIERVKIAATLFAINFFVAWFALQENRRGLVFDSYPVAFNIIFYTTMISAPGVLGYTMAAWYIHEVLIVK